MGANEEQSRTGAPMLYVETREQVSELYSRTVWAGIEEERGVDNYAEKLSLKPLTESQDETRRSPLLELSDGAPINCTRLTQSDGGSETKTPSVILKLLYKEEKEGHKASGPTVGEGEGA